VEIQALLEELPPETLRELQRTLPPDLPEAAEAILRLLRTAPAETAALRAQVRQVLSAAPSATALRTLLEPPTAVEIQALLEELPPETLRELQRTLPPAGRDSAHPVRLAVTLASLLEAPGTGALLAFRAVRAALPASASLPESARAALDGLQRQLQMRLRETPAGPEEGRPVKAEGLAEPLPSTGRVAALLRDLPRPVLAGFERILLPGNPGPASLPELAEAVRGLLRILASASALKVGGSPALPTEAGWPEEPPSGSGTSAGPPRSAQPPPGLGAPFATLLERVRAASALPPVPLPALAFFGSGDPALEPLKNLLLILLRPSFASEAEPSPGYRPADPGPSSQSGEPVKPRQAQARSTVDGQGPRPALPSSDGIGENPPVPSRPAPARDRAPEAQAPGAASRPGDPPAVAAKSWESWLSAGTKALSDPQVSPREAPFHLAQAREGTAFFELPLPWESPGRSLQLWVEEDPGDPSREGRERMVRVLVGLHFSALGDTRVGIQQSADRLQVRVWTEHPEVLRARERAILAELADLGPGLDFQVFPLGEPGEAVPSLRALAAGGAFHALG